MTVLSTAERGLEAQIVRLELERDARLTFEAARERMLEAIEGARQAHIRPGSYMGNLFGERPDEQERRAIEGVAVIALEDFNSALDAAFPENGDDDG
jgi:hypothetical protein